MIISNLPVNSVIFYETAYQSDFYIMKSIKPSSKDDYIKGLFQFYRTESLTEDYKTYHSLCDLKLGNYNVYNDFFFMSTAYATAERSRIRNREFWVDREDKQQRGEGRRWQQGLYRHVISVGLQNIPWDSINIIKGNNCAVIHTPLIQTWTSDILKRFFE